MITTKKSKTELNVTSLISEIWDILDDSQKDILLGSIKVQVYHKGEMVHCEGGVPQYMMCLLQGKVKVYKGGVGGRNQIVRMIKPVEYFGYRAYFANQVYVNDAAAFERSTICLIPLDVISRLIDMNIELAKFFIRALSKNLGMADERTVNLTQKHLRGRLAESLLFLKESYGVEEDGCTLSIFLSREDLANLSNMTTSNAIRTLSQFAAEHLIIIDGRKIKIIDEETLLKINKVG